MEEKILSILNHIHSGYDYVNEKHIFSDHTLDSLEFTKLVSALENT